MQKEAYPGIETSKIFKRIKQLLEKESFKAGIRFSLKEAMRKLGPSGFPFEKLSGEIFRKEGYKVKLNSRLRGNCLKYEIDVLAEKEKFFYIGECKFRNLPQESLIHSNTALAYWAKFLDLKGLKKKQMRPILITNAKFSKSVVKYAKCVGIDLLGWKCPKTKGLEKLIEDNNFYPITILPSFKEDWLPVFFKKKIILAKDILDVKLEKLSEQTKVPESKLKTLAKEAKVLLE